MAIHYVASPDEIPAGASKIVELNGISIGVYNIEGKFYAIHNHCPHQGAELCKGHTCGTNLPSPVYEYIYGKDQQIVRCPWHGWEFDIKTGKSLFSEKIRTKIFRVEVRNGKVGIHLEKKGERS